VLELSLVIDLDQCTRIITPSRWISVLASTLTGYQSAGMSRCQEGLDRLRGRITIDQIRTMVQVPKSIDR